MIAAMPPILPPPHRAKPGCVKHLSPDYFARAVQAVYRGTRTPSARDERNLRRFVRCAPAWSRPYDRNIWAIQKRANQRRRAALPKFTGVVVAGTVSTFGPPLEAGGQTADGGSDYRPCIALQDTSTLDRMFLVTIRGHTARLLHCDSGPYANGRAIDVTGSGAEALGFSQAAFPTDSWGIARELQ